MKKYVIKVIDINGNQYKHFETNYLLEVENIVKNNNKKYEVIFREVNGLEDIK